LIHFYKRTSATIHILTWVILVVEVDVIKVVGALRINTMPSWPTTKARRTSSPRSSPPSPPASLSPQEQPLPSSQDLPLFHQDWATTPLTISPCHPDIRTLPLPHAMASLPEQHLHLPCILPGCSALPGPSLTPRTTISQPAHMMVIGEAEHFSTPHITICLPALTMAHQWEVSTYQELQEVHTMLSATIYQAPVRILIAPPLLVILLDDTLDLR